MRQKMSMFESIRQGLQEAIDFAEGKPVKAVSPPDVKAVREHVGMKGNLLALRGKVDIAAGWQSLRQMEIEEEKTIPDGDSE
jgi:hypothetical protein